MLQHCLISWAMRNFSKYFTHCIILHNGRPLMPLWYIISYVHVLDYGYFLTLMLHNMSGLPECHRPSCCWCHRYSFLFSIILQFRTCWETHWGSYYTVVGTVYCFLAITHDIIKSLWHSDTDYIISSALQGPHHGRASLHTLRPVGQAMPLTQPRPAWALAQIQVQKSPRNISHWPNPATPAHLYVASNISRWPNPDNVASTATPSSSGQFSGNTSSTVASTNPSGPAPTGSTGASPKSSSRSSEPSCPPTWELLFRASCSLPCRTLAWSPPPPPLPLHRQLQPLHRQPPPVIRHMRQ